MPTDAFEDALDLKIGLLEAYEAASPYPRLRPTGETDLRTFPVSILENEYLRLTFVPGLGGRLISLWDKRTETEVFRSSDLAPVDGGIRGVEVPNGMQVRLQAGDRPNALGPVDVQIEEPPEALWLAESVGGTGLSFHLRVELPSGRAEVLLEVRVLNRTLRPLPYLGALSFDLGEAECSGEVAYVAEKRAGLIVQSEDLTHATRENSRYLRSRFATVGMLGPRQVDTWRATLVPFSSFDGPATLGSGVVARFDSERLQVQSLEPMPSARLLLGLENGSTVEAPADLYPEHAVEIPLGDLPARPVVLAIQDADKHERLRLASAEPLPPVQGLPAPATLPDPNVAFLDAAGLRHLTASPVFRAAAQLVLGHRAMSEGEFESGDALLEQALLYNGDDPLNWWSKAMARRLAGTEEEESAERLNAHFLAPLEPALRAEAYLAMSHAQSKEPNPLVAPLAERPEALIEVACLLLEIGVYAEASRWIDEALRHRDLAMLRYLNAWALLKQTRMEAEAAVQVAAAGRLPFEPPFPWREIEGEALNRLAERFPQDIGVGQYRGLLG